MTQLNIDIQEKIEKLNIALTYLDNVSKVLKGNQYEKFLDSHIVPVKIELKRQLSLLYAREAID